MFIPFFESLRNNGVPVSLREFLAFLEGMKAGLATYDIEAFYYLARVSMVKDERNIDKFDQAFAAAFKGLENISFDDVLEAVEIPREWLEKMAEKHLSAEEKAQIEAMGGFDKLMETLKKRLEEQKGRHQGGNKWVGTAGTSPFGAYGYNPEGVRVGQKESRHQRAVKVWDKREYKNYDDSLQLGIRNVQLALRRLREFARTGVEDEFDLDATIDNTAKNAGLLDIVMRPERTNKVKVLMFFDVGGSMDDHIRVCEELFSAARTEFKNLEFFYFHNCIYEGLWKDNRRRFDERTSTYEVMNTFPNDFKAIFVGDAFMSPYEVTYKGGSVEHWNEEPGAVWLSRMIDHWPNSIWLNPRPEQRWDHTPSTQVIKEIMANRMYPLTVDGLDRGLKALSK